MSDQELRKSVVRLISILIWVKHEGECIHLREWSEEYLSTQTFFVGYFIMSHEEEGSSQVFDFKLFFVALKGDI